MSTLEKYFRHQFQSHHCQLPPRDDLENLKKVKKVRSSFFISEKSLRAYLKMGNVSAIRHEKLRQLRTTNVLVIHPYSSFMTFWRIFTIFFHLLCFLFFPFFSAFHGPFYAKALLAFGESFDTFRAVLILASILQGMCMLEIAVNFLTGYVVSSTKEVVIHPTGIARHYLCTYFFLDLISALPVDAILVAARGVEAYGASSRAEVVALGVLPLLKLSRIKTMLSRFRDAFHHSSSYYASHMIVVSVTFFLMIHWGACLMMLVPRWFVFDLLLGPRERERCNRSWLMDEGLMDRNIFYQYFSCFHLSLTCVLNVTNRLKCLMNLWEGILYAALGVVGKTYKLVILVVFLQMKSTMMAGRILYLEMMDQVKQYMELKKFPRKLREKILLNYVYLFRKENINDKSILKLFSDNLNRDILLRMHQRLIKKVYLFSGLNQNLILNIVTCLEPEVYLENDVVYKAGEVGNCMYFISFGTVAIYSKDEVETGHLDDGDHFGEISLILRVRRSETVVAIEPTQLFRLEARDFADLIKSHPTVYSKIEKMATERYDLFSADEEERREPPKEDEDQ